MRRFTLTREQYLPLDLATTFAFFADARNLQRLTPPWLRFAILSPAPADLRAGTLIDYRLRIHGVPIHWQSEITVFEPPYWFVDVQRRGPYRRWVHSHTFAAQGDGTLVRDEVDYAVPGGSLVNRLLVAPDLARIFAYRADRLRAWAGTQRQPAAPAAGNGAPAGAASARAHARSPAGKLRATSP